MRATLPFPCGCLPRRCRGTRFGCPAPQNGTVSWLVRRDIQPGFVLVGVCRVFSAWVRPRQIATTNQSPAQPNWGNVFVKCRQTAKRACTRVHTRFAVRYCMVISLACESLQINLSLPFTLFVAESYKSIPLRRNDGNRPRL